MALDDYFAEQDRQLGGPRRAMAKIPSREQKDEDSGIDIESITQKVMERVLDKIVAQGSSFINVECKGGAIAVSTDEAKLKTVILNLLSASASFNGTAACNNDGTASVTGDITITFS